MFEIGSLNVLNGYLNILRTNLDFIYTVEIFNKGNNKTTELRTILQRESQNS
jgi:hypothetical protein